MSRIRVHAAVALAVALGGLGTTASAAEFKLKLEPTPKGLDAAEFELWIPDSLPAGRPVRGVLGSSKYHAGAGVYEEKIWRGLAEGKEMALLRYFVTSKGNPIDTSEAGAKSLLQALRELAPKAARPELEFSGLVPTGLSWGANQVCSYTRFIPERVICAVPFRATARDIQIPAGRPESRIVPLLHLPAGRETHDGYKADQSVAAFQSEPPQGALYADLVQPGDEHHTLGDLTFVMLWLDEVIDLRLPPAIPAGRPVPLAPLVEASGWYGRFEISRNRDGKPWSGGMGMVNAVVRSYAQAGGQRPKDTMTWLPSARLAKAWMSYANTGSVGVVDPRKTAGRNAPRLVQGKP
jgi:hypothetical protein